jgi:acetylornithine deacetylase/succinyl-diaminopimelate desuccinylase-like protein
MRRAASALALTATLTMTSAVMAQAADPTEPAYRALYKELIETNTTLSAGSCTLAAERMAARLKAAGFKDEDLTFFAKPELPKEGGLVAILKGSDPKAKGVLLLAHIDVVEAKREDWTRDPFTLIEEDGYFYGRGTVDDKAMASIFVDSLIRYKKEGFKPKRSLKLALTCGEETASAFNGAHWLTQNKRDLIDAEFGLNEGATSRLDDKGNKVALSLQAGEKNAQDYQLEITAPGGHSSQPIPDDPMVDMSKAIVALKAYEFPVNLNSVTKTYFTRMAKLTAKSGDTKTADYMTRIVKDPKDAEADAALSKNKLWHSVLHTTCVATQIEGGHAANALPQRIRVNVNCRILPGEAVEAVRDKMAEVIGNDKIKVTIKSGRTIPSPPVVLSDRVLKPAEAQATRQYPGVPVVPFMSTGATDSIYMTAAGIPTFGLSGLFTDPDGNGTHGLNERVNIKALLEARIFLYDLLKVYGNQ